MACLGVPLGVFRLGPRLGRGGMGDVFAAMHATTGAEAAIKLVTASRAHDAHALETFADEVRAVACLDHPAIVRVLDHGRVSDEEASRSGGVLQPGAPWIALERASGGTLHDHAGRLGWETVQPTLARILEALAHAHARGLLHRDLKPANVLVRTAPPDVAVGDFGLAHALESEAAPDVPSRAYGTPGYMAPEQRRGRWRDFGPWTDLFAFGCVAWELVTGRSPFPGDRRERPFVVPAFNPAVPVPEGFRSWALRLLAADPAERFARAADAAFALAQLGPPTVPARARPARHAPDETQPCATASRTAVVGSHDSDLTGSFELSSSSSRPASAPSPTSASKPSRSGEGPSALCARARPPVPAALPRSPSPSPSALSLYGLRRAPLVGRRGEREALWYALADVDRTNRPRAVVLEGAAGVGKSRLCAWLCETAHENGSATGLRILHGPAAARAHGLGPALGRLLRTSGLERDAALARIETVLRALGGDASDASDLVDLVRPPTGSPPLARLHAAAARLVALMARERPLVLWIDDAPWGADSLAFAAEVLGGRAAAVLVVLTARTDHLAERPVEAARIASLAAEHWPVAALADEERDELVHALAQLEDPLAARVRDRTAGNPLFAVHLVGDWIARGLLEAGPRGQRLRTGAAADLPDDLHAVWTLRIERVLEGRDPADAVALEIAALLGGIVDEGEWREACVAAGIGASGELVDTLEALGLGQRERDADAHAWAFAHGMLRESIERRARESGRAPALEAACARMLASRSGPGVAERLGRHLLGAGRHAEALAPLVAGARERLAAGDAGGAEALAREHAAALDALGAGPSDARRAAAELRAADIALFRGAPADALPAAHRAASIAAEAADGVTCAAALFARATATKRLGDLPDAEHAFGASMDVAARAGDVRAAATARAARAWVIGARGDLAEAARELRRTRAALLAIGDEDASATCALQLGSIAARSGRLRAARTWIESARKRFERTGDRERSAIATSDLAEVARLSGDLESAERGTRDALVRLRALGAGSAPVAAMNLALILVLRGRSEEARAIAAPLVDELGRAGRLLLLPVVHACLLACAAEAEDGDEWERQRVALDARAREAGYADPDTAVLVRHAAARAAANGWTARAAAARRALGALAAA